MEITKPLGRALVGEIVLRVGKDRPGYIRARCGHYRNSDRTQEAARVTVDSSEADTEVTIDPPNGDVNEQPDEFRPTTLMERVSRHLEDQIDPQSVRGILESVTGKNAYIDRALRVLVKEGYVTMAAGPRQAKLHKSIRPYRQKDDERSDHFSFLPQGKRSRE